MYAKTIIFDLGEVLINWNPNYLYIRFLITQKNGMVLDQHLQHEMKPEYGCRQTIQTRGNRTHSHTS